MIEDSLSYSHTYLPNIASSQNLLCKIEWR